MGRTDGQADRLQCLRTCYLAEVQ